MKLMASAIFYTLVGLLAVWGIANTLINIGIDRGRELERAAALSAVSPERSRIQIDCPDGKRTILYGYFTTPEGELEKGRYPKP